MFAADILRDAWRSIRRQPAFSGVAVVVFALAMALNVTVYGILDTLIAPELNIEEPERLYYPGYTEMPFRRDLGFPDLRGAVQKARSFEGVTFFSTAFHVPVSRGNLYRDVNAADVAPNFFDVMRLRPIAGRAINERDLGFESAPVMISVKLRNELFEVGEDPVGQRISIGRQSGVVVGVIDNASAYPGADVWRLQPSAASASGAMIVRIKKDVEFLDAFRELDLIRTRFATERGVPMKETAAVLRPVVERQFRARNFHWAIIGSVLAVLLVAAMNIANLQFARGLNRMRELSTRAALGATRGALIAHLTMETTLVAVAGVGAGILLAFWGMGIVEATVPTSIAQYIVAPQWSWRVFAASGVAAIVLIVVAGLLPAIRVSHAHLGSVLRAGSGAGVSRDSRFVANGLVVAQVSLALALCIGSALLARTATTVLLFDAGIDTDRLVAGSRTYSARAHDNIRAVVDRDLAAIRQVPGVTDAAVRYAIRPLVENRVVVESPDGQRREVPLGNSAFAQIVSPTWFRTHGASIATGRDFRENGEAEPGVILNDVAAREWWPNGNAVGRMLKLGSDRSGAPWVRVVGIHGPWIANVSQEVTPYPAIYLSHAADTARRAVDCISMNVRTGCQMYNWAFVARTNGDLAVTAGAIRDRDPLSTRVDAYESAMGFVSQRHRYSFIASLFATFAALALGLAVLGVYAVSAHMVAQRRREFGVRLALGATPRNILVNVLRDGNVVGLLGIVAGLVIAAWTVGLLKAFMLGMEPMEPALFGGVSLILLASVLLASLPPAIRAAKTNPVESLRSV